MASELSMNGKKKIETLQKEFTQKFPFLTLVFLDKDRRAIDISKSLSEVRQAKGADISIIASLKVNTLEKRFLENFGLIVEVAYKKSDKVVYTKDNVDKTLNELNKWCQENDCQPFEFKKSFTGNTLTSVQEQLFEAVKAYYPNVEAKKINKDNYLDIYVPELNKKRGTHLFFNTAKDGIKIGFYCRDEEFVEAVLSKSTNIEKYAQGIRILNNPLQKDVKEATESALSFIEEITGEQKTITDDGSELNLDQILRALGYGAVDNDQNDDDEIEESDDEAEDTSFSFSDFDIQDDAIINIISDKIMEGRYLTNLLYINNKLDELGYAIDKHQAYFFDSSVLISDRELEGFLVVNMDGFYSNCMDSDEMNPIFSWSGVNDIDYSESESGSSIDIISDEGTLTIKKVGSNSLKILYTFYESVWKEINENFKEESFIEWGTVRDMGINEVGFHTFLDYYNFKVPNVTGDLETENNHKGTNRLPQGALDLIACVYILKYYYLGLNEGKDCSDNFDYEFTNLFVLENFSNNTNGIIQEIKEYINNGTIDELILSGIEKADQLYEKNYQTHDDFVSDMYNYFCDFDLLDDAVFQSKFLSANIEIGNQLNDISNTGKEIKPQDRYLLVHIALSNWDNIKTEDFDFDAILEKVKYNLPAGSLLKYAIRDENLTLIEKGALIVYNVILLDDDGLEIKNKDIYRAKQLIADTFGFEKKIEGLDIGTMLKGSLNNSGNDDLGALIGGFEDNFCFDVMQFYNCNFSIIRFRNRCINLFKDSYKEINEAYGGYIEDSIEDTQFDAEDERKEKMMERYNAAINTDEEED
jgi:hypothetical protein